MRNLQGQGKLLLHVEAKRPEGLFRHSLVVLGRAARDAQAPDHQTLLARPTLVLWGENDRVVTPAYGRQLAGLIPGAQFELVPRAGHLPQLEQLPVVVGRIRAFAERLA